MLNRTRRGGLLRSRAHLCRDVAGRFDVRTVTSRQNPAVRAFRELAADRDTAGTRLLLDGAHLVADALAAHAAFDLVAVAASRLDGISAEGRLADTLDRAGADVVTVPDAVFAAMSPVRTPSGIAAIVRRQLPSADAVCSRRDAFLLTSVDVQDPGNIGSLVRVAEAGGVTGALVCASSPAGAANPFSWKALRGSMGSALRLPVVAGLDAGAALDCVAAAGVRSIAAVPRGGQDPDAVRWSGAVNLVLGGEGPGLPAALVARCGERVTIPMSAGVESLNVAAAGAILIYAARRHRP